MTNDGKVAVASVVAVCLFGGFVAWRGNESGHLPKPAHLVEVIDASESMRTDCEIDLRIITGAIKSMTIKNGSSLTIIRAGDRSTNLEPQLVFEEPFPLLPNGPLAGHDKAKADIDTFLARTRAGREAIPKTATSPIIKAVRRGPAHLKSLGCVQGTGCLLAPHSDLQDNDEFGHALRLAKPAANLDNSGIRVVLCGFTQTREPGDVKTDTLIEAWTKLFTEHVAIAPFCQGAEAMTLPQWLLTGLVQLIRRLVSRWAKPRRPRRDLMPFDLDYPLLRWSPNDAYRVRDAVTGTLVLGQTGGGKTSGPYRTLLRQFFLSGYGGIIFTTKPLDFSEIREWAAETGRLDSLIRFAPEERHRFNFLSYASRMPGRGTGLTENIVRLLMTVQESFERDGSSDGKHERYFKLALEQLLRNSIDLLLIAGPSEGLSVRAIYDVIVSAPLNLEQVDSEAWQRSSTCYRLLNDAVNNEALSPRQKADLEITGRYFLQEFPALPHDTRGSIISTFTTMADIFVRGEIGELFSTSLNIVPEVTHEGAILVIDLPVKLYGTVGVAAQTLWKFLFQEACERRDVSKNPRVVFLASDECQSIANEHDVRFLATARSSRCCAIYMTQTYPTLIAAMGGDQKGKALAESLCSVLANRIFTAQTCPRTNAWAADVFAKRFQQRFNAGMNNSHQGGQGTNAGCTESLEYNVLPAEFITLRKGGPENNYLVEAIVGQGGRVFNATGQTFIRTAFSQR